MAHATNAAQVCVMAWRLLVSTADGYLNGTRWAICVQLHDLPERGRGCWTSAETAPESNSWLPLTLTCWLRRECRSMQRGSLVKTIKNPLSALLGPSSLGGELRLSDWKRARRQR